jgi:hypothetical protein
MACPVDPNPPRDVDELEFVNELLVLVRLEVSAVETAVGARREENHGPERLDEYDEYEPQRQPLHERRRQGCSP